MISLFFVTLVLQVGLLGVAHHVDNFHVKSFVMMGRGIFNHSLYKQAGSYHCHSSF